MRLPFRPLIMRRRYAGIIVSGAAFGGIPQGSDATGAGTLASPFATLTKALTMANAGQMIWLNGDPNAPTEYRAATVYTVSKGVAINAIKPYGAIISATTATSRILLLNVPAGQTLTFGSVIIDGRSLSNTGLDMAVNAAKYTVNLNSTKIQGCLLYGIGGSSSNYNYDLNVKNAQISSAGSRAGIYCANIASANISVTNSTINIGQIASGFGAIHIAATTSNVSASIIGNSITGAAIPTATGSGAFYGVYFGNISGAILTQNIINNNAAAKAANIAIGVYHAPLSTVPLNSGGFVFDGNELFVDSNGGGMGIQIGQDGAPAAIVNASPSLLPGGTIRRNRISCGNAARTAGIQGIYSSQGADAKIYQNKVSNAALGIVDQEGNGTKIYGNAITGFTSRGILLKGAKNGTACFNTLVYDPSFSGKGFSLTVNQRVSPPDLDNAAVYCANCSHYGNNYYANATPNTVFDSIDVNNGAGYIGRDNNYYTSGTLSAGAWNYLGVNYNSMSAYAAASGVTGVTDLNPMMIDPVNGNYALSPSSPLRARVATLTGGPYVDYSGGAINAPAAIGAFQ